MSKKSTKNTSSNFSKDIFDSDKDPQCIIDAFQDALFATTNTECTHENMQVFDDNQGRCLSCGVCFTNADDLFSIVGEMCNHDHTAKDDQGMVTCLQCHAEIESLDFSQERRWFGAADNRSTQDTSRCHSLSPKPKGIQAVFDKHKVEILPAIKCIVEAKYNYIIKNNTGSKLLRGQGRIGVVAACLFHTYKTFGEPKTTSYFSKKFKIQQKHMSFGLTMYCASFPEERSKPMKSADLIPFIMKLTRTPAAHYKRILIIHDYLSATSELFIRSSPQSVAASVIYFYICLFPDVKAIMNVNKTQFAKNAGLSEITITKLSRQMAVLSKIAADDWHNDEK
jgi:transcription initiation factor TFIIIB Brf1 subunit/transcription initiation factor TFIIB